jgi:hypothetical protein
MRIVLPLLLLGTLATAGAEGIYLAGKPDPINRPIVEADFN